MRLLKVYLDRQADNIWLYALEQLVQGLTGWVPSVLGISLRALVYRLILSMQGYAAIECGVRLRFANRIRLGRASYLDQGVYIHACREGVTIGPRTYIMHGSVLHVYNFRNMPHAGIFI